MSRKNMAFEVFNVGDRVVVDGPNGPRLHISEVLKGQWAGYFHLRFERTGDVMDTNGQRQKFHRSVLTKIPEATEVRSGN